MLSEETAALGRQLLNRAVVSKPTGAHSRDPLARLASRHGFAGAVPAGKWGLAILFNREAGADIETLRHTTLATARLRFLFVAAKLWRHAGRTGVSYSDHYEDRGLFQQLMGRLRAIVVGGPSFAPVLAALR